MIAMDRSYHFSGTTNGRILGQNGGQLLDYDRQLGIGGFNEGLFFVNLCETI